MDTGFGVRQVQPPSGIAARLEPAALRQVVRSELPPKQVVSGTAENEPVQYDQNAPNQRLRAELNSALDAIEAKPTIKVKQDETTRELVFSKLNPSTGQVIQQFPDEAVMRQRIYAAQQRRAELGQALIAPISEDHVFKVA